MGWGRKVAVMGALLGGSAVAIAQDMPVAEPVGAIEAPVVDPARAAASRAQALGRLLPHLEVKREAVASNQCAARVKAALEQDVYQVFVVKATGEAVLAPLLFEVGLRSQPDLARLGAVCNGATGLVVSRFSDKVRRSKDPAVQRDYVIALTMADWAQSQLDGRGLVGREMPADVSADPFGVLSSKESSFSE